MLSPGLVLKQILAFRASACTRLINLFEQQQFAEGLPPLQSTRSRFSRRKGACDHLLGGCPRREQVTFHIIATFSQQFELSGYGGSNEIRR